MVFKYPRPKACINSRIGAFCAVFGRWVGVEMREDEVAFYRIINNELKFIIISFLPELFLFLFFFVSSRARFFFWPGRELILIINP